MTDTNPELTTALEHLETDSPAEAFAKFIQANRPTPAPHPFLTNTTTESENH